MLELPTIDEALCLRKLFSEAGYNEEGITDIAGGTDLPMPDGINWRPILDRTAEPSPLHLLVRWFLLATPVPRTIAESNLPGNFLEAALHCGLLQAEGENLRSEVMVAPYDDFLVASDPYHHLISGGHEDHVLTLGAAAHHLLNFTIRCPVDDSLDLGCGNGIQALALSKHSRHVTATDLNPRATKYARFNAALNGLEHIECLTGDAFEPVAGRKFDLICCNPPFVLTPSRESVFRDSPENLDEFCRQLVRNAPDHLKPGGFFQMILEWVEVEGQSWQDRLSEWFDGCGCDVWILKVNSQRPENYAAEHVSKDRSRGMKTEPYEAWIANFRRAKVTAIHGGLIAMRLSPGRNWLRIREAPAWTDAPFGDDLLGDFDLHDFLQSFDSEEQWFEARLKLSPKARLAEESRPALGVWQSNGLRIILPGHFPRSIGIERDAANFLLGFDGRSKLSDQADSLIKQFGGDPEKVRAGLLNMVQDLVKKGFLIPDDSYYLAGGQDGNRGWE